MTDLSAQQPFSPDQPESLRAWGVVIAAAVGLALGMSPLPFYTIGMFAPELAREFGWSFAALMGGVAVQSAVVMLISPFAGLAIDRYGARPTGLLSLGLFGLVFMSFAMSSGSLILFYAQWFVMALLGIGTLSLTWTRVVSDWFDRNRGLALGVASTGTGITGFLLKPLTAWLIAEHGWRTAYMVIGMLPVLIGIPVVWLLFRERRRAGTLTGSVAVENGMTFAQALRDRKFWIITVAFLLIAYALTSPTPNMENILRTLHFDAATIAAITAFFGLAVILGRVAGGWLIDHFWAPACACAVLTLPAAACWMLAQPQISTSAAIASVIALGLAAGLEFDLLAFLVTRYFGQRHYASIYGSFYTAVAIGGGAGSMVFGRAFDLTGSYAHVLLTGTISLILGGGLLLLLGPYRTFDMETA
jgi:MFS family permease